VTGFDVVCVGESMALVTPDPPAPLETGGAARLDVAGAESTVACYLAMLGVRSAWAGRVGDDPLGRLLTSRIASYGVDTSLVSVDPSAPTGVFFKDPGERTRVYYYRTGSAASRLGASLLPRLSGIVHLSGITPALSSSCADLVEQTLASPLTTSFDVNHRPPLWPGGNAAPVLRRLADQADIVFVGLDEAETLWEVSGPDDVRTLLPRPDVVVVKDGANGAWSYTPGGMTFAPAPAVEVIEPVGAGDAFAAGYLYGVLHDLPEPARLGLGHRVAGAALRVTGDVGDLPPVETLLSSLPEDAR
jgi:2-dehydro-3-deoxygluconokinase